MDYILIFGSLAIAVILFLNAIVIIPPYHFGIVSRLGYRLRGQRSVLREGPNLVIPLIDSVELISMELAMQKIKFGFTTKDRIRLEVEGIFQYRPDPDVVHEASHPDAGRNIFITVGEVVIQSGVREAGETCLGVLGGRHEHSVFIEEREMIGEQVALAY